MEAATAQDDVSYELCLDRLGKHLSEHGRLGWATSVKSQLYGQLHASRLQRELAVFVRHNCGGSMYEVRSHGTWTWSVKGEQLDVIADVLLPHLSGRMKVLMDHYYACRAEAQEMRGRKEAQVDVHAFCIESRKTMDEMRKEIRTARKAARKAVARVKAHKRSRRWR